MCGKVTELAPTAFVGRYCRDCHKTNIEESKVAIREIISARKLGKAQKFRTIRIGKVR